MFHLMAMVLDLSGLSLEGSFQGLYHNSLTHLLKFSGRTETNNKTILPAIYLDAIREAIVHIN